MKCTDIAKIFKALGDINRLRIVEALSHGEQCACSLLRSLNISQPTLSHHMKILCDSTLVVCRRDGQWTYYHICPDCLGLVKSFLCELAPLTETGIELEASDDKHKPDTAPDS